MPNSKTTLDISKIKMAIRAGIPLSIVSYTLPHEMSEYMEDVLAAFLKELNQSPMNEYLKYCLNELTPSARKAALMKLWHSTDKLLLIIEPGTPEGFSQLREARKLLLSEGGYIAAPCPHNGDCMLPEDDWCHFTARVARTKLHKQLKGGDAPYEDEKFCFLAVSRRECEGRARILRHPKIESGKITLKLCTEQGISDKMVTKKSPLFKASRKSDSGDSFAEE